MPARRRYSCVGHRRADRGKGRFDLSLLLHIWKLWVTRDENVKRWVCIKTHIHRALSSRGFHWLHGWQLDTTNPAEEHSSPLPTWRGPRISPQTNDRLLQLVPRGRVVAQPVSSPAARRGESGASDDDPSLSCHLLHGSAQRGTRGWAEGEFEAGQLRSFICCLSDAESPSQLPSRTNLQIEHHLKYGFLFL